MYWLRDFDPGALALYVLLSSLWALGGWLLASATFKLYARERLLVGLALGFSLQATLANLCVYFLPLEAAYWLGAGAVLLGGLAAYLKRMRPAWQDLRAWALLLGVAALIGLFAQIQRGLAILDDYVHLPLVSTIAAGNLPPDFYLDPGVRFSYHYGLHVWAGSLVRLAHFQPWSAWDLAKAVTIGLTAGLAYLWVYRLARSHTAALFGSLAALLAGGARWLLLLLPEGLLAQLSAAVTMINTGADTGSTLVEALARPWVIEGGAQVPFPFAFHNSIVAPVIFSIGSTGAMLYVVILLLLLLNQRLERTWLSGLVQALLLANLALNAEHAFAVLLAGLGLVWLGWVWRERQRSVRSPRGWWVYWLGVLGLAAVLSLVQGGYLTELAGEILRRWQGLPSTQVNYEGFGLRWPPALASGHVSEYFLFDWRTLTLLLLDLGPLWLLAPLATWATWRAIQRRQMLFAGLGVAAWISLLAPIVIEYGVDRQLTRMVGTALWVWLVLAFPLAWLGLRRARREVRWLAGAGYGAALYSGLVLLAVQLTAIPAPQYSYFIEAPDTHMAAAYWNQLPEEAQVLDANPLRAVTIFGRATRAAPELYQAYPEWAALVDAPDPVKAAQAGYGYVYFDRLEWESLRPELQEAYQQTCVSLVRRLTSYESIRNFDNYRLLYDVRACAPEPTGSQP